MGPISLSVFPRKPSQLREMQHYRLLDPCKSYEDSEVLLIWSLEPTQVWFLTILLGWAPSQLTNVVKLG
jgi:hypothetical protein